MGGVLQSGGVVQAVDQRREAERVGQQDEFLPFRRAHLAGGGHEFDALDPFRRRQIDLAGEGMEVLDRRRHDRLQARVRRRRHLVEHGVRDRFRRQLTHASLPELPAVFSSAGRYCSKPNRLLGINTRRSKGGVGAASYKLMAAHSRIGPKVQPTADFAIAQSDGAARLFLADRRRDLLRGRRRQRRLGTRLLRVLVGTGRLRRNVRGPLTGGSRFGRRRRAWFQRRASIAWAASPARSARVRSC